MSDGASGMRVLYHHRTQAEDGQAVHVRSLLAALQEEGHTVHEVGLVRHSAPASERAAAPKAGDQPTSEGRAKWGWVTRLPRFLRELAEYGYSGVARNRLVGEATRFEPDFVYERYAFGNAAGILAARKLKLPLVLEVNSPMVEELSRTRGLSFPGLARKLENYIFQTADRVCVVTGVLGDMLCELGVERERLLVTPNGVDLALYDYADRAAVRAAARRDLGLGDGGGEDELILGFVGYYRDWHRLDLAIDALLRPELAHAKLVLIGEGPARDELERHAAARGAGHRLIFAGPRPHAAIPTLLPAFDVALIPAINPYASPLKLHEYMAARLPVLAPDQPNLREVLTDGENALLLPPADGEALGDAVSRLALDADLRERLARAGRETIVERDMTWRGNARRVVEAVEHLK